MYDTTVGRWISEDPILFEAGDTNVYRAFGNGPTNATDPSGLDYIRTWPNGRESRVDWVFEEDGTLWDTDIGYDIVGYTDRNDPQLVHVSDDYGGGTVTLSQLREAAKHIWTHHGDTWNLTGKQRRIVLRAILDVIRGGERLSEKPQTKSFGKELAAGCNVGGKNVVGGLANAVVTTGTLGYKGYNPPLSADDKAYDPNGTSRWAGKVAGNCALAAAAVGSIPGNSGKVVAGLSGSSQKGSPQITAQELIGKTADEIRQLAKQKGLVPHPTRPDKWMDPVTGKERLRIDSGHIDKTTGRPYNDPKAAAPHHHGYDPSGKGKIVDPSDNNPHLPTKP